MRKFDHNAPNAVKALLIQELLKNEEQGSPLSRVALSDKGIDSPKGKVSRKAIHYHIRRDKHSLKNEGVVVEKEGKLLLNFEHPEALVKMIYISMAHPSRGEIVKKSLDMLFEDYFSGDLGDFPLFVMKTGRPEQNHSVTDIANERYNAALEERLRGLEPYCEAAVRFKLAYIFWAIQNTHILRKPKKFLDEPMESFISHYWFNRYILTAFKTAFLKEDNFTGYRGEYTKQGFQEPMLNDLKDVVRSIIKADSLPLRIGGRSIEEFFKIPESTQNSLFYFEADLDALYLLASLKQILEDYGPRM